MLSPISERFMSTKPLAGTILPKPLQGAVALYCSRDAAGTWSVAEAIDEEVKASELVIGTFSA